MADLADLALRSILGTVIATEEDRKDPAVMRVKVLNLFVKAADKLNLSDSIKSAIKQQRKDPPGKNAPSNPHQWILESMRTERFLDLSAQEWWQIIRLEQYHGNPVFFQEGRFVSDYMRFPILKSPDPREAYRDNETNQRVINYQVGSKTIKIPERYIEWTVDERAEVTDPDDFAGYVDTMKQLTREGSHHASAYIHRQMENYDFRCTDGHIRIFEWIKKQQKEHGDNFKYSFWMVEIIRCGSLGRIPHNIIDAVRAQGDEHFLYPWVTFTYEVTSTDPKAVGQSEVFDLKGVRRPALVVAQAIRDTKMRTSYLAAQNGERLAVDMKNHHNKKRFQNEKLGETQLKEDREVPNTPKGKSKEDSEDESSERENDMDIGNPRKRPAQKSPDPFSRPKKRGSRPKSAEPLLVATSDDQILLKEICERMQTVHDDLKKYRKETRKNRKLLDRFMMRSEDLGMNHDAQLMRVEKYQAELEKCRAELEEQRKIRQSQLEQEAEKYLNLQHMYLRLEGRVNYLEDQLSGSTGMS